MSSPTIHIIGAGLAGLAAGLEASESGARVVIYEAAAQAGGRCRSFYDKKLKTTIDNGNHLILGANHDALRYIRSLGTLSTFITNPKPVYSFMDLRSRKHWHAKPPAKFPGILVTEWWHMLKLFKPAADKVVTDCIPANTMLYERLIEPLTLAALNTQPEKASAQLLASVLQRMIVGGKTAWQYYVPTDGLSPALVDPAVAKIKGRGGSVHLQKGIHSIKTKKQRITALVTTDEEITIGKDDRIILATSPAVVKSLLPECAVSFTYSPIINAHFKWPQAGQLRDAMPLMGLVGGTAQWLFLHEGRISTTTSAADAWVEKSEDELVSLLWQDVSTALFLQNAKMPPCRIIKEKRATIAATPANLQKRPTAQTPYRNLLLAGDYLASPLPCTLDTAIQSGSEAGRWACKAGN